MIAHNTCEYLHAHMTAWYINVRFKDKMSWKTRQVSICQTMKNRAHGMSTFTKMYFTSVSLSKRHETAMGARNNASLLN